MFIAIDPGDSHTGVAEFETTCERTYTLGPGEVLDHLELVIVNQRPTVVICEEWRLYPWKANELGWSEMLTSQLIGAIKLLCKQNGIRIEMTKTEIKKPMRARLADQGVPQIGRTPHELDAELHGYYAIARGLC